MGCCGGFGGVTPNIPQWTVCLPFAFTNFQIAALQNSYTIATLPIRGTIEGLFIKTKAQWVGVGITSLIFAVGVSGSLALFAGSYDGLAAPSNTNFGLSDTLQLQSFGATTPILITALATGANLSVLSAGTGCLYLKMAELGVP